MHAHPHHSFIVHVFIALLPSGSLYLLDERLVLPIYMCCTYMHSLRLFEEPEQLDESECITCDRCCRPSRAFKTMELWSTPDVLCVHLKVKDIRIF